MSHNEHHEHLIKEVAEMFESVFSKSSQGVVIYLDDEHKICNQKLVDMLGYGSIQEFVDNQSFISDVIESDQEKVIKAYMDTSENLNATTVTAAVKSRNNKEMELKVSMFPIVYKGEVFAVEFFSEK